MKKLIIEFINEDESKFFYNLVNEYDYVEQKNKEGKGLQNIVLRDDELTIYGDLEIAVRNGDIFLTIEGSYDNMYNFNLHLVKSFKVIYE